MRWPKLPGIAWAGLIAAVVGCVVGAVVVSVAWAHWGDDVEATVFAVMAVLAWLVLGVLSIVQGAVAVRRFRRDGGTPVAKTFAWLAVLFGAGALFLAATPVGAVAYRVWRRDRLEMDGASTAELLALMQSGDEEERGRAASALDTHTESEVVPALLAMLDDPEPSVVQRALFALARKKPWAPETLERVSALLADTDQARSGTAAIAIGRGAAPEQAIPVLTKALEDGPPRAGAMAGLRSCGAAGVAALVSGFGRCDRSERIRLWGYLRAATDTELESRVALAESMRAVLSAGDAAARTDACWALAAPAGPIRLAVHPELVRLLSDPDSAVRAAAAVQLLHVDRLPEEVRASCVAALAPFATDPTVLVAEQPEEATSILGRVLPRAGYPADACVETLAQLWGRTKSLSARKSILDAWAELAAQDATAVSQLRKRVTEGHHDAVEALARVGPAAVSAGPDVVEWFNRITDRRSQRDGAATLVSSAIARLRYVEGIPLLQDLLKRDSTRAPALAALGEFGPLALAAVPDLVQCVATTGSLLERDEPLRRLSGEVRQGGEIRRAAVRALVAIAPDDPRTIDAIDLAFHDRSAALRLQMLGDLIAPPAGCAATLERLASSDPDESVREAAAAALSRIRR